MLCSVGESDIILCQLPFHADISDRIGHTPFSPAAEYGDLLPFVCKLSRVGVSRCKFISCGHSLIHCALAQPSSSRSSFQRGCVINKCIATWSQEACGARY